MKSKRVLYSGGGMLATVIAVIALYALVGQDSHTNAFGMTFVYISPGEFQMGSPESEDGRFEDERLHPVKIETEYYLQETEVQVGQWRTFANETGYKTEAETRGGAWVKAGDRWMKKDGVFWDNPGFQQTDTHPVTCVSWNDAQAFVDWLNKKNDGTYRLPHEAEWEYACRAGNLSAFHDSLETIGWYAANSSGGPKPTGQKGPNNRGLYDMHGNVWEWCLDWYTRNPAETRDISGPASGILRVGRGGAWNSQPNECRAAYRFAAYPGRRTNTLGFRLVRMPF